MKRKENKRKDYAFQHQFNEKPSIIPGCPGSELYVTILRFKITLFMHLLLIVFANMVLRPACFAQHNCWQLIMQQICNV